jgi:hypothetical protein
MPTAQEGGMGIGWKLSSTWLYVVAVRKGDGDQEKEERHTTDWMGEWGVEGRKSANLSI